MAPSTGLTTASLLAAVTAFGTLVWARGGAGATEEANEALPSPPTDAEKYWYLGREHRWLFPVSVVAYSLICVSMALFATSHLVLCLFVPPLAFSLLTVATSMRTTLRRRRLQLADHRARVDGWQPEKFPAIDVFLPSAGESIEILQNTFHHVASLSWPGEITVYVLDDSARYEVREAAAEWGFTYLTRPNPGHLKKAGNLRFGYEHSDGDFIAIFDADFVPRPEFLLELLPYFDAPSIGIVQSPQFFDSDKRMHWLQLSAGSTQEMFYRWIQTSRDRFDAAICVGTCAVYRRSALEQSGGFAQIGHSEDVHTGVNLLKAGFTTRYVPVLLAKGLCPDEFSAFVNQQYRWCSGSLSLLRDPTFRHHPALTLRHHLCFFAGFLYYLSTALNVLLAPLPVIVMLWWLTPMIRPINSFWMSGSIVMALLIYPCVHKSRWRFSVLRVQYLYSFAHLLAIVNHFSGRTKGWVATGAAKTTTPIARSVRRVMTSHALVTESAVWLGLIHGTLIYGWHPFWAMFLLAGANAYVVIPALMAAREPSAHACEDWVARVVRITALPPEFQSRVSLAGGGAK
ncbi:MAG: glycosyltransferase [Actinobacteria bacterium]|nr:MAG: glycosyltransferase [Actinomycetota bacterium]